MPLSAPRVRTSRREPRSLHRATFAAICAVVLAASVAYANSDVATVSLASANAKGGRLAPAVPPSTERHLLVGAKAGDTTFSNMDAVIGQVKVTRTFYPGALPATFSARDITPGVKIIVSYKHPSANTALYVKSIPRGVNVEMVFHHEAEGPHDYPGDPSVAGPAFVKAFDAEAAVIHRANPKMRVAFVGGGYQYKGAPGGTRGLGGYFIPNGADDFYLDSYQRTTMVPAQQDPSLQNYIKELAKKGHQFNGYTEYGRGVIAPGTTSSPAVAAARANVIKVDAAYLKSLPNVDVWAYWFTTDLVNGDQWRFTDAASISAWKTAAS